MLKLSRGLAAAGIISIAAVLTLGIQLTATQRAPVISFSLLDGKQLNLSSLAGRPVLVTFWATSCIECRKEMPDLIALYNELSGKGFEHIAVAMPYDPPNRVLELSERMQIPYPIAIDIEGKAVSAFGNVPATPSAFLISPEGKIVMSHSGLLDMTTLRRLILEMLPAQTANITRQSVPEPHCSANKLVSIACSG